MHIADVKIPSEWTTLDSLISSVDEGATYILVNNSPDELFAVEGDASPNADIIGVPIASGNFITYQKGAQAHLYLRNGYNSVKAGGVSTYNKVSNLTVNKVG